MLKFLTTTNIINQSKTKCGEIYCHSYVDFTIYCTFCDIKLFAYDDFVLHLQNVHLDNNFLESKLHTSGNEINNELENKGGVCFDNSSDVDITVYTSSEEDESIMIINKNQKDIVNNQDIETLLNDNLKDKNEVLKHNSIDVSNKFYVLFLLFTKEIYLFFFLQSKKARISSNDVKKLKDTDTQFFFCPECKEKFPHKKYLDSHVYDFHNGYKCTLCDKRFRLRHHLRRHIQIHTAEKKFPCTIEKCGRSFSDEQYLKRHLEIHTMERTFICDFENCGKAFQTQRRLIMHNYTHRGPKRLVCDTCGYSCRANITLRIHQRVHTGEKPFPCGECQKCFISKTALTEHMITHSKTRPHVCKICNANFANQRILQRHTFIHSDERNFKCKLCDSSFKQANGLDGHMRRMHRAPKIKTISNNVS